MQFGNPQKGERPSLENSTRRLVRTRKTEKTYVCAVVDCEMCITVRAKSLFIVTFCKSLINAITIPNPVYSHKHNNALNIS
jgi:hypothetical protein